MTKKTEMVSVPRLLIAQALENMRLVGLAECVQAGLRAALDAAPAEDVRAVVEEPVSAYQAEIVSLTVRLAERDKLIDHIALMINKSQALNQLPQRPVVLSENSSE